jgi:hypothetical protein
LEEKTRLICLCLHYKKIPAEQGFFGNIQLMRSKRLPGKPQTGHFSGALRFSVYPQTGQIK